MNQLRTLFTTTAILFSISALALQSPPSSSLKFRDSIMRFYGVKPTEKLTIVNVKGYQQTEDYTCGPAAVMSLMHFYGMLKTSQMTHSTELQIAKEMGTSKDSGTSRQQMVTWLLQHGFDIKSSTKGNLDLLRSQLEKGVPVIVDWIDWGGHWVVATGYTKDIIFLADPYVQHNNVKFIDGINSFNINRFAYMWYDSHLVPGIYIIAVPKTMKRNADMTPH